MLPGFGLAHACQCLGNGATPFCRDLNLSSQPMIHVVALLSAPTFKNKISAFTNSIDPRRKHSG